MEQGAAITTPPVPTDTRPAGGRTIAGLSLVAVALLFGVLPCWLMGRSFFPVDGYGVVRRGLGGGLLYPSDALAHHLDWASHSLPWYVSHRLHWGLSVGALHLIPLWYWWWRRSRMAWGGLIGAALSLATAAALWLTIAATHADLEQQIALCRIGGYHPALVASAFALAAAFVVAPRPRDPEALSELQVKSLVRKHK